jgi:hypothetical protein
MKWLKSLLMAGASLLAMTASARADFVFTPLTFALFAGPLGAIASPGLIYAGLQVATAAALAVGSALAGRQSQKIDPGQYKNTFEESEASEVNAIGRVRLGGLKAFGNTREYDRYRLIWHCKGPLVAIENYHLGGREVTVEPDGIVSSPPYTKPGGSYIKVLSKPGDGTETAWDDLMAAFPTLWTADHKCRGIAQSLVKYISPGIYSAKFGKMYQGGEPPLEITARILTSYDPRDPEQDVDDPATWTWTDNGPLCAARVMLAYPDLTVADFDWQFLAGEADRADVLVATKTGTEKRSRCSGVWPSEAKRGDTMKQVLASIGAEIVLSDAGLIRIRLIDDAPEAEIQFLALPHITDFAWKSGPDAVERPNVCQVKYYAAEMNYEMAEIDMTGIGWARIDAEVERYGEKAFVAEYPFCPSAAQAQRNARRDFALERADSGAIRTNMVGLAAWGLTYADIEDVDAGETMLCRMAPPRIDDAAGDVEIPFAVWPDLPAWGPETDEAAAPEQVPEIQYESELDTPAAPAAAALVQYEDLSYETRLKFTAVTGGTIVEAVYRGYTGGEPDPFASMTEYDGAGTTRYAWAADDTSGARADFKVRFFNAEEEGSYFSPPLTVDPMAVDNSAPAAPTLDVDVDDSGGTVHFDLSATSNALNAAKLTLERLVSGVWTELASNNGRPEIAPLTAGFNVGHPSIGTTVVDLRARAIASDGTAGTTTYSYTVLPDEG